jgi:SAM-dependent methyltransferase
MGAKWKTISRRSAVPALGFVMPHDPSDLQKITTATLGHYERNAEEFWRGTHDHDVSQNIAALLDALSGPPPFAILDFGCGPGRDLKQFADRGHKAIGLDGTKNFVDMARAHSGCDVWHQDFLKLDLPETFFDGVFANASLFHVPSQELPRVLQQLYATLKQGGALFSSNPRGDNRETWVAERFGAYHDLDAWRRYMGAAGFHELSHYYRPEGAPREQQPWLASVWRKPIS